MGEIILAIVVGLALYWYLILRPGRIGFWQVAAKYPDAAYDYFKTDQAWTVFEDSLPDNYREHVPEPEWVGPFTLFVPKLGGRTVRVFGNNSILEKSQNVFIEKVKNIP